MTATERDRLVILETKVDGIDKKLDMVIADHEARIRCLENQPAKKWDKLTMGVILLLVSTGVGLIAATFFK